jgi:ribokinase
MNQPRAISARICVIGSANIDLIFRTQRLPQPGETLAGHSLQQCMGGKGANQAVAAARLGARVTFVARIGNDAFGIQAVKAYQSDGIDTSFVQRDTDLPTGTAAILVDDLAENCIIVVGGANQALTTQDIQNASLAIEQADLVLCQLETPVQASIAAFRIARAAGVTTVLTPAPVASVTDELLSLCDVCVPNRTEMAALVNRSVERLDDAELAAKLLRQRGVHRVVLTMGSEGALVVDESGATFIPPYKVKAIDTTGAGDAFTAALAVSLAEGQDICDAARRASLVAAISVTRRGTQTSFPSQSEVEEWRH